jgi:hypothetical protein
MGKGLLGLQLCFLFHKFRLIQIHHKIDTMKIACLLVSGPNCIVRVDIIDTVIVVW